MGLNSSGHHRASGGRSSVVGVFLFAHRQILHFIACCLLLIAYCPLPPGILNVQPLIISRNSIIFSCMDIIPLFIFKK